LNTIGPLITSRSNSRARTSAHGHDFVRYHVRGLLYGTDYEVGESYRGIWDSYGSYDYIAPPIFRVSSTALFARTTEQWWLSRHVAMQGSALLASASRRRHHSAGRRPARLPLWCDPPGVARAALHLRPSDHARFPRRVTIRKWDRLRRPHRIGAGFFRRNRRPDLSGVPSTRALESNNVESHRHGHYGTLPDRYQSEGTFSSSILFSAAAGLVPWTWRKNAKPETE